MENKVIGLTNSHKLITEATLLDVIMDDINFIIRAQACTPLMMLNFVTKTKAVKSWFKLNFQQQKESLLYSVFKLMLEFWLFTSTDLYTNKVKLYCELCLYTISQNWFTIALLLLSHPSPDNHFTEYWNTSSSKSVVFQNILHRMQSFPWFSLEPSPCRRVNTSPTKLYSLSFSSHHAKWQMRDTASHLEEYITQSTSCELQAKPWEEQIACA